jgi:hypothetical protein
VVVGQAHTQFQNIADFRKHNLRALKPVLRAFTLLYRDLDRLSGKLI